MVRDQWANLARMPGLQPYSFEGHPRIFNDHRESGPRFNVSSEGWCFLQYSVPITILGREHTLLASLTPLPVAT